MENLLPPCALSRHSHVPGLGQEELSTGKFLGCRRADCCAAPETRTKSLRKRCSVLVLPNLPGGLLPARGERVLVSLGAVAMMRSLPDTSTKS